MRFSRGSYERLIELERRIRAGRYPNCTVFARDLGYDRKTVQRDINYLRDTLGAPIEFDRNRNGYYFTDASWKMPTLQLTEGELFLLLVAERMALQFRGTPLAANLESVFRKIRAALPDNVTIDPVYLNTQLVSFHGHPVREISPRVWISMVKALRRNRVIRILYQKPGGTGIQPREVEPLHLACIDGEWYLIAFCRVRQEIRHFAVSRTHSVKQMRETSQPRQFNPEEYFKNRFMRYIGEAGKEYKVEIRFSKDVSHWLRERTWHPKQKTQMHRDGSLTISFPAPALYEVQRWVLQWGLSAEVLAPKELRNRIARDVKSLARTYR